MAVDAEWWRGAVLYQIYPRSYQDANGDGVGDLAGIISRLDHVASLGVDGIWISPVFTSPMDDFGYDVSDYCDIDPLFGTLADFDRLVAACHQRGLKLIIDQVYSHTSDQHDWFNQSRSSLTNAKSDWYVWADAKPDGSPPNNWQAVFGGPAWTWDSRRGQYYLHNFLVSQPDLNLHNPQVQEAILAVARFWLDRGVDGFRLDVADFYTHDRQLRDNPPSGVTDSPKPWGMQRHLYNIDQPETLPFVERLRAVTDEKPGRMMVAELASDMQLKCMADYTAGGNRFHTAYSFVFLNPSFGAAYIRKQVNAVATGAADAWPSWSFSNHDVVRAATRWGAGKPRHFLKTLIALLTSLRGTAFLYQGEELGLPEAEVPRERLRDPDGVAHWPRHKGRDGCRTPMPWRSDAPHAGFSPVEPWLPVDPRHLPLAVDQAEADPDSVLHFTRQWLNWRRTEPLMKTGALSFIDIGGEILAFVRGEGPGRLVFIFNLGDTPTRTALPEGDWTEALPLGGVTKAGAVVLEPGQGFVARLG
jgi:alpha-glucosidase